MVEQHDMHRYRLCFWRQAYGTAVPGKGIGSRAGRPATLRTGQTARSKRFLDVLAARHEYDDMLDIEDALGKRRIQTEWGRTVILTEDRTLAALEVMSRFAVHPKWINYLPPTMSPCETTAKANLLEHPEEALDYYRRQGTDTVVCEEKHMGSRAVIQICRDAEAARDRFGIETGEIGVCYTRTGRRFFNAKSLEAQFLDRLCMAISRAGLWEELQTTWLTLDCELMPWSMKAMDLIRTQYAAVGAAANASLSASIDVLSSERKRAVCRWMGCWMNIGGDLRW